MEYISAEEFLKQPKEVQNVFREWWEPKENDLYFHEADNTVIECFNCEDDGLYISHRNNVSYREDMSPIFSERQLRKFIEDKINSKIEVVFIDKEGVEDEESYYRIERVHYLDGNLNNSVWITEKNDLLQAYWEVAIKIIREKVKS